MKHRYPYIRNTVHTGRGGQIHLKSHRNYNRSHKNYKGYHGGTKKYPIQKRKHMITGWMREHPANMFFLLSFFIGAIGMNYWKVQDTSVLVTMQQFLRWGSDGLQPVTCDLLYYLLKERGCVVLLMCVLCRSKYEKVFLNCLAAILGFGTGVLFTIFVLLYGVLGVPLLAASLFPQGLIYFCGFFLFLRLNDLWKEQRLNDPEHIPVQKRCFLIAFAVLDVVIFLFGIISEAYLNPYLLTKMYEFVCI